MIPDDQLDALKDRNPVHAVAGAWVTLRRHRRTAFVGPCPICSDNPQSKTAARFECDADKWVCAVCEDGGDVIKLVAKREGIDFRAAVDRLGGVRDEIATPDIARRRGLKDLRAGVAADAVPYDDATLAAAWRAGHADGRRQADYAAFARNRERERLRSFLRASTRISGTPVEHYLAGRGLIVPDNARLRFHPAMHLFTSGREVEPVVAHVGPAMLAPFYGADGAGIGLHITWLDQNGPKGKARVIDPETGEVLPAKKMRGSKAGGYIDLGGAPDARRMIAGEGIETVAAVYTALLRAGRDLSATAFRAAGDLGNLAGRAVATIPHPTLKTSADRVQRVPGLDPDLTSPALPVPDAIEELVLLGDGDSDPFTTGAAMERAKARHARPGRLVRVAFAPRGFDFDDLLK